MILIVGGAASGKRTYIESLGYTAQDFGGIHDNSRVCYGLETILREGPLDEKALQALVNKEVVSCCEVGSGVVPVEAQERAWRELVGRTTNQLAAQANAVVRMVCGIPVSLKP